MKNYIYSIAGRVGVDKTVRTFVELTVFGSLGGPAAQQGKGPPTMVDKLTFTTMINLSATPKVEFTPTGDRFQLLNANLKASADRSDRHEVAIGLAIARIGVDEVGPIRQFGFSPPTGGQWHPEAARPISGLYQGARVTGGRYTRRAASRRGHQSFQVKSREVQLIPAQ